MSFQFMYPLVGRLDRNRRTLDLVRISIHAPLAGCDYAPGYFLADVENFNPRTPCGVRHGLLRLLCWADHISIPAPLAGCDPAASISACVGLHFNPRTPCGVRRSGDCRTRRRYRFQSTHPLRGATLATYLDAALDRISIHAPLAGCDAFSTPACNAVDISIHAPLAGCDSR